MLKKFIFLLFLLAISLVIIFYVNGEHGESKPVKSVTPEATFKIINGQKITLASLKGKPVLVVFWATTCKICIEEIPDLIELHHLYEKQGLEIIAVAMPYDHPAAVVKLARRMKLPYKVALDVDSKVLHSFINVQVTPTVFLVAKKGHIIMHTVGRLKMARVKRLIEEEINKQYVIPVSINNFIDAGLYWHDNTIRIKNALG